MSYVKRRIAVFLAMLMVFTTAFCVLPQETAQAADRLSLSGEITDKSKPVQVEKGVKDLYIGDYISAIDWSSGFPMSLGYLSQLKNVTYTSSNKNVLKVDKKTGKAEAKKTGSVTITVKYKGQTEKIKMKVVSSSAMKKIRATISNYDQDQKAAKAFLKTVGTANVKKSNRYKMLKAVATYKDAAYSDYASGVTVKYNTSYKLDSVAIYSTQMGRKSALLEKIHQYFYEINPFATNSSKSFKLRYVSGKANSKEVKIKLKSKVTEDQMYGLKYQAMNYNDYKVSDSKTCKYKISLIDKKDYRFYDATVTVKQGKNYITIKTKDLKLKKGRTYMVTGLMDGVEFTAK